MHGLAPEKVIAGTAFGRAQAVGSLAGAFDSIALGELYMVARLKSYDLHRF